MKAIVIKNNDFETIGFEVKSNGLTIYQWGIASELKTNFQKEINVNDWMPQIIDLIKLEQEIRTRKDFVRDFFDTCGKNKGNMEYPVGGVIFEHYEEKTKRLIDMVENIVKNII